MSKEEILEGYLNVIYLGNQAYGVHAGSYTYFNKPPGELELHEAATLAALPKFPSYADGLLDGEGDDSQILDRRNWVLDRMADLDMISESEAGEAKEQPIGFDPRPVRSECIDVAKNSWGFFCDYFKQWWGEQAAFGETERDRISLLKRGGFKIVTSLDPDLQKAAMSEIHERIDDDDVRALGSVTITPGTGHVRSMAVNRVYSLDQTDNGPRSDGKDIASNYPNTTIPLLSGNNETAGFPAGSTFKMFTMLAALEEGWPLRTTLPSPRQYASQYKVGSDADEEVRCNRQVDDYGNEFWNWCPTTESYSVGPPLDMWKMFGKSSNTAFVALQEMVGTSKAVEMAERLGISFYGESGVQRARDDREGEEADDFLDENYGVFTLGMGDSTTPLDMAEAYATVAAEGRHCEPLPVLTITGADGDKWEEAAEPQCDRAVSKEVARAAISAARCPVNDYSDPKGRCNGGTAGEASGFGRPIMGKTGTADSDRAYWFMASTPNATTATFVGDPDMSSHKDVAADFHDEVRSTGVDVLKAAVKGLDEEDWPSASDDMINGKNLVSIPSIGCESVDSARSKVAGAGFEVVVVPGQFDSECEAGLAYSTSVTGSAPNGSLIHILVSNGSQYEDPDEEDDDDDDDDDEGGGGPGGPGGDPTLPPGGDDFGGPGDGN